MAEQSFVQVRIDNELKQQATDILSEIGMDMPNAIRMFLRKIVIERGLPFDTKLPPISPEVKQRPAMIHQYIPAKPAKEIEMQEYIELLCKVPAGKITRQEDIETFLCKKYNVSRVHINMVPLSDNPFWKGIPHWREVSTRGMLSDTRIITREQQKEMLEKEGLSIVPCGAKNRSLKVENYRDFLFDFDSSLDE